MKTAQFAALYLLAIICALRVAVYGQQDTQPSTGGAEPSSQLAERSPDEETPDISFPTPNPASTSDNEEPNPADINWNETVDFLLATTNNETQSKGRDEVPIPDVNEQFTRKVGPLTLRGEFKANEGRVTGLSSLHRTGDVTVVKQGTSFTMTCPVGLRSVRVRYGHYRVKISRGGSMSGQIEGKIGSNSIQLKATIDVTDQGCSTRLDEVKILELSGLKIEVHGLGAPFDYLLSKITTWLTNVFRNDVHNNLERALTRELTKGLERSRCEKYASYFIFVSPK